MMKKIFMILCLAVLGMGAATAQVHKGDFAVGANLVWGSEIENFGLGAHVQYGIIDNLRAEAGFNGFFKNKEVNCWEINIDAHYLIGLYQQRLFVYPVVGLNYTMVSAGGVDNNHLGLNLGAGLEYEITEHWGAKFEYRHTIVKDVDQSVIALGANYKF